MKRAIVLSCAAFLLAACANTNSSMLGDAVAANIETHSVSDVTVRNTKPVEDASGVAAARAIQAFEDGKTAKLPTNNSSSGIQ